MVIQLCIRLWMGSGRCLNVTLGTCASKHFHACKLVAQQLFQACVDTRMEDPYWPELKLFYLIYPLLYFVQWFPSIFLLETFLNHLQIVLLCNLCFMIFIDSYVTAANWLPMALAAMGS